MTRIVADAASLLARAHLARTVGFLDRTLVRLSTGSQLNSARDNPAALIASETLRAQIVDLEGQLAGHEQSSHVIELADSAMEQITRALDEVYASSFAALSEGTLSDEEAAFHRENAASALESIDRIIATTKYQGRRLFDGARRLGLGSSGDSALANLREQLATGKAGIASAWDSGDVSGAVQIARQLRSEVTRTRARLGAIDKYAQAQREVLTSQNIQLTAARSQLYDADFARETAELSRLQILRESGVGVLRRVSADRRTLLGLLAG